MFPDHVLISNTNSPSSPDSYIHLCSTPPLILSSRIKQLSSTSCNQICYMWNKQRNSHYFEIQPEDLSLIYIYFMTFLKRGPIMLKCRFILVFIVSTVTCLHALIFQKVFFFSCCSTSFHPLSETRAQSALIG